MVNLLFALTKSGNQPARQHEQGWSNNNSVSVLQIQTQISQRASRIGALDGVACGQMLRLPNAANILILGETFRRVVGDPNENQATRNVMPKYLYGVNVA